MRDLSFLRSMSGDRVRGLLTHLMEVLPRETAFIINGIAGATLRLWRSEAIDASRRWGERFADTLGMDPIIGDEGEATVYHDDESVNFPIFDIIENGIKSWSIRDALLNSKRVKTNSRGIKYIVVPFRWRTPTKTKPKSEFTGVMPSNIYELVKRGEVVTRVMAEKSGNVNMAGMKRFGDSLHGQYLTFRTVSETTPSDSWQYPHIPATPVFERVKSRVERMIGEAVENYVAAKVQEMRVKL